jgi:glycosyltransferase domain-containing protein
VSVTIVLTLKGRPLHTLRWMWHHDRTRLPFPVIVADGGEDPEVEKLLSDPANFPNLNYKYLRYHDRTLPDFYFKMTDVVAKVETPHLMLSDNDDFVLPSAVRRAGDFLLAHPDYVSAGGGYLTGFTIFSEDPELDNVSGDPLLAWVASIPRAYDDDAPVARLERKYAGDVCYWYNIMTATAAAAVFGEVRRIGFRSLDMMEHFVYSWMLIHGKIKMLSDVSYARQFGTSQTFATLEPIFTRIIYDNWVGDLDALVQACADKAAADGHADADAVAAAVRDHFHDHFLPRLAGDSKPYVPPGGIVGAARRLLKGVPALRRLRFRRKVDQMVARLRREGMGAAEEQSFRAEFGQSMETLAGPGFPAWLAQMKASGRLDKGVPF